MRGFVKKRPSPSLSSPKKSKWEQNGSAGRDSGAFERPHAALLYAAYDKGCQEASLSLSLSLKPHH